MLVIDAFEMVEVGEHDCHRTPHAMAMRQFLFKSRFEVA